MRILRPRPFLRSLAISSASLALVLSFASPSAAVDPYAVDDQTWISVTGTVADTSIDEFTLDYGRGLITVEMEDWDWYTSALPLRFGDRVTVLGRIDDDLFEGREIKAERVYVAARATYYYPSDAYASSLAVYGFPALVLEDGTWVSVSGKVAKVGDREFLIEAGDGRIQIDTIGMAYNPLDDTGFQKIEKGDRVSVTGRLDLDFFERREIQADTIVTLSKDAKKKQQRDDDEATPQNSGDSAVRADAAIRSQTMANR